MQCTLTGDTPAWLFALTLALGAVAVGLGAECVAVGITLRWRGTLARWGWALALPLALALWCLARAVSLWQLDADLLAPGQDSMTALIANCESLSKGPLLGEMTLGVGLLVLAGGVFLLVVMPGRARQRQRQHQPAPIWPVANRGIPSVHGRLPARLSRPAVSSGFGSAAAPTVPMSSPASQRSLTPARPPLPSYALSLVPLPAARSAIGIEAAPTQVLPPTGAHGARLPSPA